MPGLPRTNCGGMVCQRSTDPKLGATEKTALTLTTPTARGWRSWSSHRRKSPAATPIRRRIPAHEDAPHRFREPNTLAPPFLLDAACAWRLVRAARARAGTRQAAAEHRRGHHRVRIYIRRPHRLRRESPLQDQAVRPGARRHLDPGCERQAAPYFRRREIPARRRAVYLQREFVSLVAQWPHAARGAVHRHGR